MSDRGRKVPVHVGDTLVLSLPENPTTGVRWVPPKSDALEVLADDNVPGSSGIGAAGLRVLKLRPIRPGSILLRLLRHQAWEDEDTADEHFEAELDIR